MAPRLLPVLVLGLLLTGCGGDEEAGQGDPATDTTQSPSASEPGTGSAEPGTQTGTTSSSSPPEGQPGVRVTGAVASDLEVPWGLDFLPDGRALVTERDRGTISVIGGAEVRQVGVIPETFPTSEGGLLGLAVSPDFESDRQVFVYVTTEADNRVLAMRFDGEAISDVRPILTGIPAGVIHDGGQLEFGPGGFLYVSTGETGDEDLAQDPDSLGGKILRITTSGQPAPGNPDPDSPVWSLGHRNV
ncbi:MAG: PQQ-dependent sugar dehydrogenase, partial [Nocardioidaceae bacterium]|nr:PQQ-dependent sugar dehydrogenase [Nocardioidaceae bacterium]